MTLTRWNWQAFIKTIRTRTFWLYGVFACLVLIAAFQIPYTYTLVLGSAQGRFFILGGVYDPEPSQSQPIRWTDGHALFNIPALTGGDYSIAIRVNGWQPESPAIARLRVGDAVFKRQLNADWIEWQAQIKPPAGDLVVALDTNSFNPSALGNSDKRKLGVQIDSLELRPTDIGLRLPPFLDYVLPMTLAVMLSCLGLSFLALRPKYLFLASSILLLSFVVLIGFYRMFLNVTLVWVIVGVLGVGLAFMLFGLDLCAAWYKRAGIRVERSTLNWLGLTVFALLALKWIGILYPQMYAIDALFHEHRLETVARGNLFFVAHAREFGGLDAVYPPALYVFLTPLTTLRADPLLLLKVALPVLEALGGLVLFGLANAAGLNMRASWLAVFLYLGSPFAFFTFGWGVYANIMAQLLIVTILAVWFVVERKSPGIAFYASFSFFALLGILAHSTMLLTLTAFLGIFCAAVWLGAHRERRRVLLTGLAFGLALVAAFGVYFSVFVDKTLANLSALETRASTGADRTDHIVGDGLDEKDLGLVPVAVNTTADWVREGLVYLVRETWVYYRSLPVLATLLAILLLWHQPDLRLLWLCLVAGVLTVLIFFLVGFMFNLYTRYMLFGAPFFALGAGYVLDRIAQRGIVERALVLASILGILLSGLGFWAYRVVS